MEQKLRAEGKNSFEGGTHGVDHYAVEPIAV
jgi:hypothetical protein